MSAQTLGERFAALTKCVCQGARLMVGFPDYDTYVEHMRRTHPDAAVMTYPEFFRERQSALWGRRAQGFSLLLTLSRPEHGSGAPGSTVPSCGCHGIGSLVREQNRAGLALPESHSHPGGECQYLWSRSRSCSGQSNSSPRENSGALQKLVLGDVGSIAVKLRIVL